MVHDPSGIIALSRAISLSLNFRMYLISSVSECKVLKIGCFKYSLFLISSFGIAMEASDATGSTPKILQSLITSSTVVVSSKLMPMQWSSSFLRLIPSVIAAFIN